MIIINTNCKIIIIIKKKIKIKKKPIKKNKKKKKGRHLKRTCSQLTKKT
jgi:hypothetical protein